MDKTCYMIVAFMLLVMINSSYSLIRCKEHELEALLKFKQSFARPPQNVLSSWVGEDCCQWNGVTCNNVTNNIVKLIVRGSPPSNYYEMYEGTSQFKYFSPALLELKYLSHLDLSYNDFNRTKIPEFIGFMSNLRYLNLSRCKFSGQIPTQLGNIADLIRLDLSGAIDYTPQEHLGWASSLSKLQSLDMSFTDLSLANNTIHVLFRLPSLLVLGLEGCNLREIHLPKFLVTNSSSLSQFSTIQHLDLESNYFLGSFPSFLQNISSLQSLSLRLNGLNGTVPLWLGNMKQLEYLDLSSNAFDKVDGGMWGIIGNPCIFKHLDLSLNKINQGNFLDPFTNTSSCVAYDFEYLNLGANFKLQGNLPSLFGRFTKLSLLDLSKNEFEGGIPMSFSQLSAVKYIDLSDNRLSGSVLSDFGQLTELEYLDISSNSLHGTVSGIGNLSKLYNLDTNFNDINLTLSFERAPAFQLQIFKIHSCGINTAFPQWIRNQTQISILDLSYAGISGELPIWLWNMTNIRTLQLSGNQLTGSLPQHIACDGCSLGVLELHNNMFSGEIPHWLRHSQAKVIDLSDNLFSGVIFEGENASTLLTTRNYMYVLDLSDNMLSGGIQLKNVYADAYLQILSLRGNDFSGLISSQLCNFPQLVILELAQNHFTGHIPRCLGSVRFDSDYSNYAYEDVDIQEIIKGITERFNGGDGIHSMIDLSSNHLVGSVPEELTNISKLMQLNLSNNHFTGAIPGDIGNLQMLESLDLSNNNLSGTIPQSLATIPWLSKLNVSNNRLHGPIPSGSQLQTLDNPSIYAGNSGLYGFPLLNQSTKPDRPQSSTNTVPVTGEDDEDSEDKDEKLWFYLVIMSGVAAGFWGVVGTLIFKKSWRRAYFQYVEDSADKIYVPVKIRTNRLRNRIRKKMSTDISGE